MSKIGLLILTAAAFLFALYLVAFRRPLPDTKNMSRLGARFFFLVALCLVILGCRSQNAHDQASRQELVANPTPKDKCFKERLAFVKELTALLVENKFADSPEKPLSTKNIMKIMAENDFVLFDGISEETANNMISKIANAVTTDHISLRTGLFLTNAVKASIRYSPKIPIRGLCYAIYFKPPTFDKQKTAEQIHLLINAKRDGTLSDEIVQKIFIALSRELGKNVLIVDETINEKKNKLQSILSMSKLKGANESYESANRVLNLELMTETPDSALVASEILMQMHGFNVKDCTIEKRQRLLKNRLRYAFSYARHRSDWFDPKLKPNVDDLLRKAQVDPEIQIKCYRASLAWSVEPQEKKLELSQLQTELLNAKLNTGIINEETARKVQEANAFESQFAIEKPIREQQELVRRVMRILYQHDEASSLIIKRMEQAIDCPIIDLDPEKALRHDFLYYLQWIYKEDRRVINILVKRGLIDPPIKHTIKYERNKITKEQIAAFRKLLDEGKEFELEGDDAAQPIFMNSDKQKHNAYRLKVRFAIRAMIKSGACSANKIEYFEEFLGLPVLGKIP